MLDKGTASDPMMRSLRHAAFLPAFPKFAMPTMVYARREVRQIVSIAFAKRRTRAQHPNTPCGRPCARVWRNPTPKATGRSTTSRMAKRRPHDVVPPAGGDGTARRASDQPPIGFISTPSTWNVAMLSTRMIAKKTTARCSKRVPRAVSTRSRKPSATKNNPIAMTVEWTISVAHLFVTQWTTRPFEHD
jgi:hypothetical protein